MSSPSPDNPSPNPGKPDRSAPSGAARPAKDDATPGQTPASQSSGASQASGSSSGSKGSSRGTSGGNSGASTPPPGSRGYRAKGDSLPRGVPLSSAPSRSQPVQSVRPSRPTHKEPSSADDTTASDKPAVVDGSAAAAAAASTGSGPQSVRPKSTVTRPPTPQPLRSVKGDTSGVLSSPKVPVKPQTGVLFASGSARPDTPTPPPRTARPIVPFIPVVPVSPAVPAAPTAPVTPAPASSAVSPQGHASPPPPAVPVSPASTISGGSGATGNTGGYGTSGSSGSSGGTDASAGAVSLTRTAGPSPKDRRTLWLVLALLVSLAAHGTLAWELYDEPLGKIDPSLISQQRDIYRVYRAPADLIIPDAKTPGDQEPAQDINKPSPSPLTDLSMAMLSAPSKANPEPTADIQPKHRPIDDRRPESAVDNQLEGKQSAPDIDLPSAVQKEMLIDIPLATRFVGKGSQGKGKGSGLTGGISDGAGSTGNQSGNSGDGQSQAASLLDGDDHFAPPANPLPPTMPAPTLTDKADITDTAVRTTNLSPTDIDLSSITDKAATELAVPEHLDNDFDYAVTRFEPKSTWGMSDDDKRGYFRVDITAKHSLKKLKTMPKDLVLLVDTSESVPQSWIDSTMRGIRDSLSSLNPDDRFNIVLFSSKTYILGPKGNLPVTPANLDKARAFLKTARSGGETDVNRALSRLLVRDVSADRSYELVLISDGRPTVGVMSTRELINLITRDNDLAASIYCVGIGKEQNHTLLEFLAYRNKGFCVYASDHFQAAIVVRDLLSRLRYPIMKDVKLSVQGLNKNEVFPADLPTIHQGETFSIYGRYDNPGKPFTMRLMGHNGKQVYDFTFTRDLSEAPLGESRISRDWGFWKLHHIYNEILRQGDTKELRQEIDYLRRKYKLKTVYND